MKSVKDLRKTAYNLTKLSLDESKNLDPSRIQGILNLISSNSLDSIGIKLERSQTSLLLKLYSRYLKNLIRERSVLVTTAQAVPSHQRNNIETIIKNAFQKDQIEFVSDKTIIGGIKFQNGWDIIDNTIETKLHKLKF